MVTTVGVVGAGNMGSALVRGWSRSLDRPGSILVHDVVSERLNAFDGTEGVVVASSLEGLVEKADVVVVVVKPKDTPRLLETVRPYVSAEKIIVSSAAGVTLDRLRKALGPLPALLRIMPNLGVGLGEGVVAVSAEQGAPTEITSVVVGLFESMGVVEVLPEDLLDAVTAAAGSSIGFLALALEGMEDGAVRAGMPRATARRFVRQTAVATALLLRESEGSAADLKDQVASPGGTTIAGLAVLEDRGVRGAFLRAVEEATERGRRL